MALTSKKLSDPKMTWEDLYTFITGVMSEHLAPVDAYVANSNGTPTHKQVTALGAQTQHYQKDCPKRNFRNWTCARCGD